MSPTWPLETKAWWPCRPRPKHALQRSTESHLTHLYLSPTICMTPQPAHLSLCVSEPFVPMRGVAASRRRRMRHACIKSLPPHTSRHSGQRASRGAVCSAYSARQRTWTQFPQLRGQYVRGAPSPSESMQIGQSSSGAGICGAFGARGPGTKAPSGTSSIGTAGCVESDRRSARIWVIRCRFAAWRACWSANARKRSTASSSDSRSDVWNARGLSRGTRSTLSSTNSAWWQSSPSMKPQEHECVWPILTRCFWRSAGAGASASPASAPAPASTRASSSSGVVAPQSATTKDVGPVVETRSMRRRSTPSAPRTSFILFLVASEAVFTKGVGRAPTRFDAGWRAIGMALLVRCCVRPAASCWAALELKPWPLGLKNPHKLSPYVSHASLRSLEVCGRMLGAILDFEIPFCPCCFTPRGHFFYACRHTSKGSTCRTSPRDSA